MLANSNVSARRIFGIALCCAISGIALGSRPGAAGDLSAIRLKLEHVNDYTAGYIRRKPPIKNPSIRDHRKQGYRTSYIDSVIKKPVARPVHASVCKSLATMQVRMTSNEDGKRCSTRTERVAPGTAAFVWTLRSQHPILKKTLDLQTVRKELKPASRKPDGDGCFPLVPPATVFAPDYACQVRFDVPLVGGATVANAELPYSIHFEALDATGKVIESRTEAFDVPRKVPLVVSVGESLAAGQGNPDVRGKSKDDNYDPFGQHDCEDDTAVMYALKIKPVMLKKPTWFEPMDYRSLRSGPALAVQALLQRWPYVNFLTFAKSGSKISASNQNHDVLNQLEEASNLLGNHYIDVLLISAGGNDVGFADVLGTLAKDFRRSSIKHVKSKFRDNIRKLRTSGYPAIPYMIRKLKLNVGTVIINEYPGALFNNRAGEPTEGCGLFDNTRIAKISKPEAVAIFEMGQTLNKEVMRAAERNGWRFVTGLAQEFNKHGYCTGKQSYYRSATESCDMQGDFEGTMHPNEIGTAIYAKALAAELRKVLPPPGAPGMKQ